MEAFGISVGVSLLLGVVIIGALAFLNFHRGPFLFLPMAEKWPLSSRRTMIMRAREGAEALGRNNPEGRTGIFDWFHKESGGDYALANQETGRYYNQFE